MLSAALALVPPAGDSDLGGEGLGRTTSRPPIGDLDQGREGLEGWLTAGSRPFSAERHLIKDPLTKTSEPAMDGGEVRLPGPDLGLGGGLSVSAMLEVRRCGFLDRRKGVEFSWQEIRGNDPAAYLA